MDQYCNGQSGGNPAYLRSIQTPTKAEHKTHKDIRTEQKNAPPSHHSIASFTLLPLLPFIIKIPSYHCYILHLQNHISPFTSIILIHSFTFPSLHLLQTPPLAFFLYLSYLLSSSPVLFFTPYITFSYLLLIIEPIS